MRRSACARLAAAANADPEACPGWPRHVLRPISAALVGRKATHPAVFRECTGAPMSAIGTAIPSAAGHPGVGIASAEVRYRQQPQQGSGFDRVFKLGAQRQPHRVVADDHAEEILAANRPGGIQRGTEHIASAIRGAEAAIESHNHDLRAVRRNALQGAHGLFP